MESDISHEESTTSAVLTSGSSGHFIEGPDNSYSRVSSAGKQQDVAEPVSSAVSSVGYPFEVTAYSEIPPTGMLEDFAAPVSPTLPTSGNSEVSPTDEQQDVAAPTSAVPPTSCNTKVSPTDEQQDVAAPASAVPPTSCNTKVSPTYEQQDVAAPASAVPPTLCNTEVSPTDEQQDVAAHVRHKLLTSGNFLEQLDNCEVSRTVYWNDVWSSQSLASLLHDSSTVLYGSTFNPVDDEQQDVAAPASAVPPISCNTEVSPTYEQQDVAAPVSAVPPKEADVVTANTITPFTKSRKKKRNVEQWKASQRKLARQTGQQYTSSSGRTVEAKRPLLNEDLCKCRMKCGDKLSSDQRQEIFNQFYAMDEDTKNTHLFHLMKPLKPKFLLCEAVRHRSISFAYYVTVDGESHRVCKTAFIRLHRITGGKVDHIGRQLASGRAGPLPHARGKHHNRPNRCSDVLRAQVCEHIGSFPAEQSHYSRSANSGRQYLSSELKTKCTNCIRHGAMRGSILVCRQELIEISLTHPLILHLGLLDLTLVVLVILQKRTVWSSIK